MQAALPSLPDEDGHGAAWPEAAALQQAAATPRRHESDATLWLAASVAAILLAVALRGVWHTTGDVSWLLEIAERTLQGARPYRDFLEVNPPASFLIYIPAVFVGHLIGATPEATTNALVFLGTGCSLGLTGAILLRASSITHARALLFVALVVLLVLPLNSFAQREHIAVLAILPSLAAMTARARLQRPAFVLLAAAGLGAGVAVAIKPLFGLGLLGPALLVLRAAGWRRVLALPEIWIACTVSALYALSVVRFAPEFADSVLPLLAAIYLPARAPLVGLLSSAVVMIWLAMAFTLYRFKPRTDSLEAVLFLASAGFQLSFFIQGKGFVYQDYPAVALAILACAQAVLRADGSSSSPRLPLLQLAPAATAALGSFLIFAEFHDDAAKAPGLTQAIAALSPRPRVLTISGDMSFGRVFVHAIGGEWVGSMPLAWITLYAEAITSNADHDPRFASAIQMERDRFAADIERERPDAVLIDGSGWFRWSRHSVALIQALSRYRPTGQYGEVTLWSRDEPMAAMKGDAEPAPQHALAPLRRSLPLEAAP